MNPIFYIELLAFIFSFFLLHPRNNRRLWPLIVAYGVTVIAEYIGYYFKMRSQPNHYIYNISVPLVILLFGQVFHHQLKAPRQKRIFGVLAWGYILFCISNLLWIQGFEKFCTYNYVSGGLLLSVLVSVYLIELLKAPTQVFLAREPLFMLAAGILLLYVPKSINYSMFEYLAYTEALNKEYAATFFLINNTLGFIFYLLASIASVCRLISKT